MPKDERVFPDDPLEFIKTRVKERKIKWTYHVNMRMKDRFISREYIINPADSFQVIEEHPNDKYLPSYLIYSEYQTRAFHILFAADVQGDNVRIVTAYYPTPDEWNDELKTRRSSS